MSYYRFFRLGGLGLIVIAILVICSCNKADKKAFPVDTNGSIKQPDGNSPEKEGYVLGKEVARAVEAEKRRQRQGTRESPLSERDYDFWHGDQFLIDPAPSSLDDELRKVVRSYAASQPRQRAVMRDSISMEGFYTLMTFARRSAVFAMRERKVEIARGGLIAVAMIDPERVDFRDIPACLYLLYHAANRIGADADGMFREVGALSDSEVGKDIVGFVERASDRRSLSSSLFVEVETEKGLGFIDRDIEKYNPTLDLKSLSIAVARLVAADKYQPESVALATDLPSFWLSRGRNAELERVLEGIRGGATISARLRPGEHPKHESQQFTIFIVETSNPSDAQTLVRLSQSRETRGHSMVGVAAGRLFTLVVARAFMDGVDAYETPRSLARFEGGLATILARYAGKAE
jgi:hypothetical protein